MQLVASSLTVALALTSLVEGRPVATSFYSASSPDAALQPQQQSSPSHVYARHQYQRAFVPLNEEPRKQRRLQLRSTSPPVPPLPQQAQRRRDVLTTSPKEHLYSSSPTAKRSSDHVHIHEHDHGHLHGDDDGFHRHYGYLRDDGHDHVHIHDHEHQHHDYHGKDPHHHSKQHWAEHHGLIRRLDSDEPLSFKITLGGIVTVEDGKQTTQEQRRRKLSFSREVDSSKTRNKSIPSPDTSVPSQSLDERGLVGDLVKPLLAPLNIIPGFVTISNLLFGDDTSAGLLHQLGGLVLHVDVSHRNATSTDSTNASNKSSNSSTGEREYAFSLMASKNQRTQVYLSTINTNATTTENLDHGSLNRTMNAVQVLLPLVSEEGKASLLCATYASKPPSTLNLETCRDANATEDGTTSQRFSYNATDGRLEPMFATNATTPTSPKMHREHDTNASGSTDPDMTAVRLQFVPIDEEEQPARDNHDNASSNDTAAKNNISNHDEKLASAVNSDASTSSRQLPKAPQAQDEKHTEPSSDYRTDQTFGKSVYANAASDANNWDKESDGAVPASPAKPVNDDQPQLYLIESDRDQAQQEDKSDKTGNDTSSALAWKTSETSRVAATDVADAPSTDAADDSTATTATSTDPDVEAAFRGAELSRQNTQDADENEQTNASATEGCPCRGAKK